MMCPDCFGRGWVIVTRNGVDAADRCLCKSVTPTELQPPTSEACAAAAEMLISDLRFAPKNDAAFAETLTTWLCARISSARELEIFKLYVLENLKDWQGIAGLKELLVALRERRAEKASQAEYERTLLAWREEAKMLGAQPEPYQIADRRAVAMLPAGRVIDAMPALPQEAI